MGCMGGGSYGIIWGTSFDVMSLIRFMWWFKQMNGVWWLRQIFENLRERDILTSPLLA